MSRKFFFLFLAGLVLALGCNFPRPEPVEPTASLTKMPAEDTVPAAKNPFGIEGRGVDEINLVQQAGAGWFRRNALLWNLVEPQPGARDWKKVASLEAELRSASAQGLQVILVVRGTPGWAQMAPGLFCGPPSQQALPALATFLHDAVERYAKPPFNVKYWELGNEPDVDPALVPLDSAYGCWGNPNDPGYGGGYYATMLKQAYPQIKSADPQAQVLVGGLLLDCDPLNPPEKRPDSGELRDCSSSHFLEGILQNGGGDYLDGVSFHAYDYYTPPFGFSNPNWHTSWNSTGPALIAKANYLRDLLKRYGHADKYLINTEVALLCGRDGKEPICQSQDYLQARSSYLVEVSAATLAEGVRANIWYSLRGWRGSQLVDETLKPNSTYQAYQFMAKQLQNVSIRQEVSFGREIKGYEFSGTGGRIWLIWSLDGNSYPLALPQPPQAVYDLQGNQLTVANELNVGSSPVYVVWNSTGSDLSPVSSFMRRIPVSRHTSPRFGFFQYD